VTGDHYLASVNPNPHIISRNKKSIAMVAKLATELPVDPDSLSHCNPACKSDKTITPFRMSTKLQARLLEKDFNTLHGNFFCRWSTGSFFHENYRIPVVVNYKRP
jgi:hypothetical protein